MLDLLIFNSHFVNCSFSVLSLLILFIYERNCTFYGLTGNFLYTKLVGCQKKIFNFGVNVDFWD
uniref:Uncharacterized protein n=1 Tax=Rhizophora mucronata TaxID=61149 RepID=A0A2P2Q818_RHIMU